MFASVKQALPTFVAKAAINVDDVVTAEVAEVHQDQIAMKVLPSGARGILSIANLAHFRNANIASLRKDLKIGETLENLKVVAKNPDNGLLILVNQQSEEDEEKSRTKISGVLNFPPSVPVKSSPQESLPRTTSHISSKCPRPSKGDSITRICLMTLILSKSFRPLRLLNAPSSRWMNRTTTSISQLVSPVSEAQRQ
jgi:hypothetical protein